MQFIAEEGPNTELSWLLYAALGFFLLMVIVGWLTSRRNDGQVEVTNEADDLTSLEGIGPKVSKILNGAGIHSFADLAKANDKEVDAVLDEAGLQMMDSIGWIEQAKLAAKGDTEGLMKLQDELKGGRRAE
ncbi:MAG TPA: helix-hairpin-helix domain-containing protein [Anaerolineales bacterium]|nr:helix-hairpin-helix domain-containing protein [Anaerolineales bacterium]